MKYIISSYTDPKLNLAIEEYAFKKLLKEDLILILWFNTPSVIVGKHQNTFDEINYDYLRGRNIEVLRRISGGGAVYHDENNLNYSIISNENKGREINFKTFTSPILKALEYIGVSACLSKRNDILVDDKKICGHAQAYINGRVLHHGCLLFNTDLQQLSNSLKNTGNIISSKGLKSCRAQVANISSFLKEKMDINTFCNIVLDKMKEAYPKLLEYKLSEKDLLEIEQHKEKYYTWEWNYGRSPNFIAKQTIRINEQDTELILNVDNGKIEDLNTNRQDIDIEYLRLKFKGEKYPLAF